MLAIAAQTGQVLISCNYDATGLEWVDLFDNPVLGWVVDETTLASLPIDGPVPPFGEVPIIVGALPPAPAATTPILSPQWAHFSNGRIYVPNLWRGTIADFLTWIATNNGANRKVRGNFSDPNLVNVMYEWKAHNAELFNETPF